MRSNDIPPSTVCTIEDVHPDEAHPSVPNTQKSSALMAVRASGRNPAAGDGVGEVAGGRADGEDDADAVELGRVAVDEQPASANAASVATITLRVRRGISNLRLRRAHAHRHYMERPNANSGYAIDQCRRVNAPWTTERPEGMERAEVRGVGMVSPAWRPQRNMRPAIGAPETPRGSRCRVPFATRSIWPAMRSDR
jgi:hypothetical protein